jgi:hypothetical protein
MKATRVFPLLPVLALGVCSCWSTNGSSGGGPPEDTDEDSDTDPECGAVDQACCAAGTCDAADLVCVQMTGWDVDDHCYAPAVFTSCAPQGYPDARCEDVSDGGGLGVCRLGELVELSDESVCETELYGGFCCPAEHGGDDLGFGGGGGSMCGDVDMEALSPTADVEETIASGVGVCVFDGAYRYCGVPCASILPCPEGHIPAEYVIDLGNVVTLCFPDYD